MKIELKKIEKNPFKDGMTQIMKTLNFTLLVMSVKFCMMMWCTSESNRMKIREKQITCISKKKSGINQEA